MSMIGHKRYRLTTMGNVMFLEVWTCVGETSKTFLMTLDATVGINDNSPASEHYWDTEDNTWRKPPTKRVYKSARNPALLDSIEAAIHSKLYRLRKRNEILQKHIYNNNRHSFLLNDKRVQGLIKELSEQ